MPPLIVGTLNIKRKEDSLEVGLQVQACHMDEVLEGPLSAAGAAEPKLLVRKLKLGLEVEREVVNHYPLQRLGDARGEADQAIPFGEGRAPAGFGHCQNLCTPPLAQETLTLEVSREDCDEMWQ